jgi:peptidylprolyl isomerase
MPERGTTAAGAAAGMRSPLRDESATSASWGGSGSWGNHPSPRPRVDTGNTSGRGGNGEGRGDTARSAPDSRRHISELSRTSLLNRCDSNDGYGGEEEDDAESASSCSSLTSDEPWSSVFMRPTTTTSSSRMIGGSSAGAFESVSPSSTTSRDEKKLDDSNHIGTTSSFLRRGAAFREKKTVQFHQGRVPHPPSRQQLHDGEARALREHEREDDAGPAFVPYLDGDTDAIHTSRGIGDNTGPSAASAAAAAAAAAVIATCTATLNSGVYPPPPPFGSVICFVVFSSCPRDRLVVELFQDHVPAATDWFQELCCLQEPKRKGQLGSIVQRIVPNSYVQVGDSSQGNGTTGRATTHGAGLAGALVKHPGRTPVEPLFQHSEPGLLSVAIPSASNASPSSHFFITVRPMPHLDGRHVVFGRVLIGMDSVVRDLTHNTALDDRQRPMFDRISIVDCGHIIHGKEVRVVEEPIPAGRRPVNVSPESALQIVTRPAELNDPDAAAPTEADNIAAPPSVFAFTALKAAALAVVSCDAFSPFASIAANEPTDDGGENSLLLSTRTPKAPTLFDSLSTESEADTESLLVAGSENVVKPVPATVPAAPTNEPPVEVINTAVNPVSPTETLPIAPTIPFSFSTFSATSTLSDVSAFLRSPFKGPQSPAESEAGNDGARSPYSERPPNGSPQAAVVARGANHPDDRDPPDGTVDRPSTIAARPQTDSLQHLEQVPIGNTLFSDAPVVMDINLPVGAARSGSSSSHGSKLEPPGLVFEDEASAFCAGPGAAAGKATGLGTADPGADTIASSYSLKDFLTTSEDAVAEFLYPAAASQGSDGLREDAMDSPNNKALENAILAIGSSDSDVEHKALPGVSLTTRDAALRTGLTDEGELGNTEPPNLYSISYSTVASGSLLAGSPSAQGPNARRRGPGSGSRSSCTDSNDDDEDDSLLQPSGTFESTLDAASSSRSSTSPTSSESAPYTFISSSNPFGWAAAAAARGGRCGTDNTTKAVRRLVATDPPPAGGLVTRRLVPSRIGTETSSMTLTRSATPRWASSASSTSVRSTSAGPTSLRSALRPARYTPSPPVGATPPMPLSSSLSGPPSPSPSPDRVPHDPKIRHRTNHGQETRRADGAVRAAFLPGAAAASPGTTTSRASSRTHSPLFMSSILSDPMVSSELEELEEEEDAALSYVPEELRDLVAEAAAALEDAQQSFLSSVNEETDGEEDDTTTTAAGER